MIDKLDGLAARAKSVTWNVTDTVAAEGETVKPVTVTEWSPATDALHDNVAVSTGELRMTLAGRLQVNPEGVD